VFVNSPNSCAPRFNSFDLTRERFHIPLSEGSQIEAGVISLSILPSLDGSFNWALDVRRWDLLSRR
jgi:hypothetical protein